jgi:hypothetical protein
MIQMLKSCISTTRCNFNSAGHYSSSVTFALRKRDYVISREESHRIAYTTFRIFLPLRTGQVIAIDKARHWDRGV